MNQNNQEYILDHQDWKQIIIRTKNKENKTNNTNIKKLDSNTQKLLKIEKKANNDELKHDKITIDLKLSIIKARNSKNLTQKQLAINVNMPLQKISDIETGKAIYNSSEINKIKRYLNIK